MNTITIVVIIIAICYSVFIGGLAANYRKSVQLDFQRKNEKLDQINERRAHEAIMREIHIKDTIKKIRSENKSLKNQVKLLTPTTPDEI